MNEHRSEPRFNEQANISVWIRKAPNAENIEGKVFNSHSNNISMSGMKLNVNTSVPVGSTLDLEVLLSNSPIKYGMIGNVVWTDTNHEGDDLGGEVGVTLNLNSNTQKASWNAAVSDL